MEFPYGEIVKPPEGFAPPEAWPEFGTIANPPDKWSREWVGENPLGYRWALWPFCFEQYVSDDEPDLEKSKEGKLARNRFIGWKRISRKDILKGWHVLSKEPWRVDGFHLVDNNGEYSRAWSKDLRRRLRIWQGEYSGNYAIEIIPFEEFKTAYLKSTVAGKMHPISLRTALNTLRRKCSLRSARSKPELWGVRNIRSREIIAGMTTYYSAAYRGSVYECPFAHDEGKSTHATVGLMGHWFSDSISRGAKILLFTSFWHAGKPLSWKGFSEFKSQFNLQYIAYPPALFRLVKGRLY